MGSLDAAFIEAAQDPESGCAASFEGESCLIAFGGIAGGLKIPPYEFFRLTESMSIGRVFIRDHEQAWYQRGVRGLGSNIEEVGEALRRMTDEAGVRRIVTIGNSAGGFAAIVFGIMLGAEQIHAIAPQTFLTRKLRARHVDLRWAQEIWSMRHSCTPSVVDLVPVVEGASARITLHYSTADRLDRIHAARIATLPGVTAHAYGEGGHKDLVKRLRDTGQLASILQTSFEP